MTTGTTLNDPYFHHTLHCFLYRSMMTCQLLLSKIAFDIIISWDSRCHDSQSLRRKLARKKWRKNAWFARTKHSLPFPGRQSNAKLSHQHCQERRRREYKRPKIARQHRNREIRIVSTYWAWRRRCVSWKKRLSLLERFAGNANENLKKPPRMKAAQANSKQRSDLGPSLFSALRRKRRKSIAALFNTLKRNRSWERRAMTSHIANSCFSCAWWQLQWCWYQVRSHKMPHPAEHSWKYSRTRKKSRLTAQIALRPSLLSKRKG